MQTNDDYIRWLIDQSVLHNVQQLSEQQENRGAQWQRPYANAQPRAASELASVWLAAYPPAVIPAEGASVLKTLGDEKFWQALAHVGIKAVHTGPMKRSGGISDRTLTPTIDGNFDRISLEVDPQYGTTDEYMAMCRMAQKNGAIVIGDIIPGHTGKGADFRLAERAVGDYPGIYHMVPIDPADWALLPPVPQGRDSVNLAPATVDLLHQKGYIVGRLSRVIFYEPGVKETNWSATDVVTGGDGVDRRWVYLHYFKEGQPQLNWLDVTCAAPRFVLGDALHSLHVLGERMLRLDANGFLGVEVTADGPAWSEGHPLSVTANQLIAGYVRKLGAFTFQELNLTVDDIAAMSHGGADLAYDFITRPAYHHALVTGDTEFLRLTLAIMAEHEIDPAGLVHALQNHDELTLELVHFWTLHQADRFTLGGRELTGAQLREEIRALMYTRLTGENAPYNRKFVTNGVASTTASVIAAALGIRDLTTLTPQAVAQIRRCHLLLTMYNAFQPGVFALSGWDLVGALPLPGDAVADLIADGDTRWINRGGYDLMDENPAADMSVDGLPKAPMLYGSIPDQLTRPDSFLNQLRHLLDVRARYRLYAARQVGIAATTAPGLLVMVHELPQAMGYQVTALNFGATAVAEVVELLLPEDLHGASVVDMLNDQAVGLLDARNRLSVTLAAHSGASYLLQQGN